MTGEEAGIVTIAAITVSSAVKSVMFIFLARIFNQFRKRSFYPVTCLALTYLFGFESIVSVGRMAGLLLHKHWFVGYIDAGTVFIFAVAVVQIQKDTKRLPLAGVLDDDPA